MSGTVIKTKFSLVNAQPASNALQQGEQAYSYISDKLWIGWDNAGVIDPIAIGGKFYTDQLPSASTLFGQLTANQANVVDSDSKIDQINIDNVTIDGNTISTTNTNGNLTVDPNGTGSLDIQANTDIVGNLTVSGTQVFTGQTTLASVNVEDLTSGRITFAGASGELQDSGNLTWGSNTFTVTGSAAIDNVRIDGNTISAIDSNGSLTITPDGTGVVTIDTNTVLVVASGSEASRPAPGVVGDGAVRYNQSSNRFEGTVSGNWTGLGGVVDIDQDTYISAEAGTTDDDTLRFYAAGTEEMTVDANGVDVTDQITTPIANITTANTTTENVGTLNVATQLTVDSDADFNNGIDVLSGNVDIADNLNVTGNTVIGGDLTVNGTTTTVNTEVTTLKDPVVTVGDGSIAGGDANDRGVNFEYGDGASVQAGFFGMDMETKRFSFKPIVDTADENYVAPWGDAQFDELFLSGDATVDNNLVLSANDITTTSGDLTITPAGGDITVDANESVTGNLVVNGNVTFDNDVPVTSGGTGMSSFTGNGVFISNAGGTALTFVTGSQYDLIQFTSAGVPFASNVIDGGTF